MNWLLLALAPAAMGIRSFVDNLPPTAILLAVLFTAVGLMNLWNSISARRDRYIHRTVDAELESAASISDKEIEERALVIKARRVFAEARTELIARSGESGETSREAIEDSAWCLQADALLKSCLSTEKLAEYLALQEAGRKKYTEEPMHNSIAGDYLERLSRELTHEDIDTDFHWPDSFQQYDPWQWPS